MDHSTVMDSDSERDTSVNWDNVQESHHNNDLRDVLLLLTFSQLLLKFYIIESFDTRT